LLTQKARNRKSLVAYPRIQPARTAAVAPRSFFYFRCQIRRGRCGCFPGGQATRYDDGCRVHG
jgi:hypothetical protein